LDTRALTACKLIATWPPRAIIGDMSTEARANVPYVICPKCADPVAVVMPPGSWELKVSCICQHTFAVRLNDIRHGVLAFDRETKRWKLDPDSKPSR
jgi:hypothetical protein